MKPASIIQLLIFAGLVVLLVFRVSINGWGSLAWAFGIVGLSLIRAPHQRTSDSTPTEKSHQDTTEKLLLAGVSFGSALVPMLHLASGLLRFANYDVTIAVPIAGVAFLLFGLWLFWRSHSDLGRNWSVTLEIREEHGLVTGGVYRRVRHPMYTAIFLIYIAQALLIHNWIAGPAGFVAFLVMYVIRVPIEESMMRERFGEVYERYVAMTGRILPRRKREV